MVMGRRKRRIARRGPTSSHEVRRDNAAQRRRRFAQRGRGGRGKRRLWLGRTVLATQRRACRVGFVLGQVKFGIQIVGNWAKNGQANGAKLSSFRAFASRPSGDAHGPTGGECDWPREDANHLVRDLEAPRPRCISQGRSRSVPSGIKLLENSKPPRRRPADGE